MSKNSLPNRRAGVVLLIVMVCLAIAMTLVVGWARIAVLENRQARAAEDHLQAEWLAESAMGRAAAQLLANPDYQGESWHVTVADLGRAPAKGDAGAAGTIVGTALITVESVPDNATARQVRVRADYPTANAAGTSTGVATNRISKRTVFDCSEPTAK